MKDLSRRATKGEMELCNFDWMIENQPHGCCLPPNHEGEHWCSCEEVHQ